ncbi:RcnB family protein [Vulcaniibacterium tengchongense]|uniref:Ni/Co efflux regulator RcnB n=1 Tax=Vulcaniibacterium tengchongense TaxID=1273429 RepID=A0A3N4VBG7_9GAMM|nr:RcnB family protein [Vulcaniibacterium tengchongense]RPE79958.1 Ni/Co efflux regulator RcnB [Vulcaniibacterium tengchongense]
MKRLLCAVSLAGLLLASSAALAKGPPHGGHPPGHHKGWHSGHKDWKRGEKVPVVYLEPKYVVDYHHHHLAPPPPGHRWIRTDDGKYLLIAVATGIIADILLHH